ncbi:MAG: hypothetical protein U9Q74_09915 [Gemmatimonadota bacterium]|nr:hypothetical protein [Gemmatimonadota bacterium]
MTPHAWRAPLALVVAAILSAGGFFAAGTGAGALLQPLSPVTTLLLPLTAAFLGVLVANDVRPIPRMALAVLGVAMGGAGAILAGWLPLAWFGFYWWALLAASVAGVVAGARLALMADARVVGTVGFVLAGGTLVAGHYLHGDEAAIDSVVVEARADAAAPALEAWQEVIGSDAVERVPPRPVGHGGVPTVTGIAMPAPRPSEPRRVTFSDSTAWVGRVSEWDDEEHLAVVVAPPDVEDVRGLDAFRAGWGETLVVPGGVEYDLTAVGDTATTIVVRGTFRMAHHQRAYPARWMSGVAQRRADELVAVLRTRAEARAKRPEPALTGEMRMLRDSGLAGLALARGRDAAPGHVATLFVNGAYAVEAAQQAGPAPVGGAAAMSAALDAVLLHDADRARTTMWMWTAGPSGGAAGAMDTVRFRYEDWQGRCVEETAAVTVAAGFVKAAGQPRRARCELSAMRERARRARVVARLALSAGDPSDSWSVVPLARGETRVFLDSVVFRLDTLRLIARPLDGNPQRVDSVVPALSVKTDRAWYATRKGTGLAFTRDIAPKEEWTRTRVRFTVPVDATVTLDGMWPTFEVILGVPKTPDNTYGRAWTYAHAPMAYFRGVRLTLP